jgi:WD40 repeat protein
MSSKMLYEAIALIRAAKLDEARRIIFEIIRNEPTNEMAWMWLAETLASDSDRMKVLLACQLENPNSRITKMAIQKLQEKIDFDAEHAPTPTPFRVDETFDPNMPERTGHTGAIIGFDGSFIVSEVADFDEVIDLRIDEEDDSTGLESGVVPFLEDDDSTTGVESRQAFLPDDEENIEPGVYDVHGFEEDSQSSELEYEPDLSGLFQDEELGMNEATPFEIDESLSFEPGSEEEADHLMRLFSDSEESNGENLPEEELTAYDLGFLDDEPTQLTPYENNLEEDTDQIRALIQEEDLVEDKVIESGVEEFERRRKKKDRNLVILVAGLFILIGTLCVVALYVILNYSQFSNQTPIATSTQMAVIQPTLAVPTATIAPTVTETPEPTLTPTTIPTATPLVSIDDRAINPDNVSSIQIKLEENYENLFVTSLDGNRIAIANGEVINIWNPMDGSQLFVLDEHTGSVTGMKFSDDGNYLVSSADDFSVYLWNTRTGMLDKKFFFDGNAVNRIFGERGNNFPTDISVDYSPDGSTIGAGAFGLVSIFDITTGLTRGLYEMNIEDLKTIAAESDELKAFEVKFNQNGWVLSAAMSGHLVGVDSLDATPLYQIDLSPQASIQYADDRLRMLEADIGGVLLRRIETGETYNGFGGVEEKPDGSVPIYELSNNWDVIGIESDADENDVQLSVWKISTDEQIADFAGICVEEECRNPIFAFAPKGEWIAVEMFEDNSTTVQLFDLASLTEIHRLNNFSSMALSIAAAPTGELVAVLDQNGVLRVWDVDFGAQRVSLEAADIEKIEFSRNGRYLFGWNAESFIVWSLP